MRDHTPPRPDARLRVLYLLRHGQSTANAAGEFTGWTDVPLTSAGEAEATRAGQLLAEARELPDVVHTSVLRRTIRTAEIALAGIDRSWVPVRRSWRLNERHYGALTGRNKAEVRREAGDDQFTRWRRSFSDAPPAMAPSEAAELRADPRYRDLPPGTVPDTESLADVLARVLPYWADNVATDLRAGRTPLVVAHGNSLRALVMHLDKLRPNEVAALNIPTGMPLRYEFDERLLPLPPGGRYLDPHAADTAAATVAAEGR
ncbi:2,3-bisphosphoglycerate-dependent phosphoglycerate mutase [Amycolatopsis silviterrae]|uniref:2,3-bisphosphoglycerate-dependent phosphoglycerate mutase n=1 Tax=Amycolatopsis silviterrae TaxID=1656914 RepID=A0ABW5HPQ1_9PSEU